MTNSWSKQVYVQGFDYEYISFKKSIYIFGRMETAEIIYKGVVTPSYKKLLGQKPTVLDPVGKREENPPCKIITPQRMGAMESNVNDM